MLYLRILALIQGHKDFLLRFLAKFFYSVTIYIYAYDTF